MKNIDYKKAYKLATMKKTESELKALLAKGPNFISVSSI